MKPTDVQRFNAHLDQCSQCAGSPFELCANGRELLLEAADHLGDEWQWVVHVNQQRERLQQEADANLEYYKGVDEP